MPALSSYRNQSIDLHSKLNDWFVFEGNTGIEWVNGLIFSCKMQKVVSNIGGLIECFWFH